jgi:hypothetical protein
VVKNLSLSSFVHPALETQVNEWLNYLGSARIVKIKTALTTIAGKPNDGTYPCIVVTV